MRTIDIRLEVLRNNSRYSVLIPDDTPKISVDMDGSIKASLSATVLPSADINWLSDEICPVLIIDGEESRLGIFAAADVVPSIDSNGFKRVRFTAYDRCWKVKTVLWSSARKINKGRNYLDAVESLLVEAGITQSVKVPTSYSLREDKTWDLGTDYLTIINELLSEINYDELHFDENGFAVLYPVSQPTPDRIKHSLTAGDIKSLLLPEMSQSMDIYDTPNVFICVCSPPGMDKPLVARAVNDNPLSPLSTISRGREIAKYESVRDIASQKALEDYADQLRWESMGMGEVLTVKTALRPGHNIGDVVALVTGDWSGIYIEKAYTMELCAGGVMQHSLRRVIYNYG